MILLPDNDEEWQALVDSCEGALALDSARQYGLIRGGPGVNVARCETLLKAGAARGYHPRADAAQRFIGALLAQPVAKQPTHQLTK